MGKPLQGLNLLTLLIIAGGQTAIAQALTCQFAEAALAQYWSGNQSWVMGHGSLEQYQHPITNDQEQLTNDRLRQFDHSATTVTEWFAQIEAASVQITGVRLEETEAGLQVVLETAQGELTTPTTTVSGNALIAEIPNAVLALPEGNEFQQFEPAEGIALVQVTGLPGDRVQVVITGADAAPTAEVNTTATGLTLSLAPGQVLAGESDEPLRIMVTGEEGSRYVEPTAATGTRTDTPLRDIPQSIQVIPREVLEDQQVTRLSDALRNVSGVFLGSVINGLGQEIIIRGFNRATILRDGFRQPANSGFPEISNLERIEVLKGPASVLFGQAEPGGLINLVSKQPLSEPFYELESQVGNQALFLPSIDITGPLTSDDRLLYRLNVLYSQADSFRDFDQDLERFSVAPTLTWNISENTNLTARLEYLENENPVDAGIVAFDDGVVDVPFDRITNEPDDKVEFEFLQVGYDFEHRFSDNWRLRNAFRFFREEEDVNGSFNIGFDESTGDVFRGFFSGVENRNTYEVQTNVVGEFATGPIEHTLLFGSDYTRAEIPDRTLFANFSDLPPLNIFDPVYGAPQPDSSTLFPLINEDNTTTDKVGVYIQDQVDILDNLILMLGGRFDFFNQDKPDNLEGTTANQYEEAFSPRVGLVYQPIQEVSLYTSYSRSFLPNDSTTFSGDFLEPERGEQFEVGARAELLNGRFVANLALFNLTKQNVAVPDPDFPGLGFSIASGERRSRGVELDISGEILPGLNLIANYAYLDAIITEDNTGLEGNQAFGAPEHSANLWTTYEIQSGDLQGLSFGIGFNFVGERFGDDANSFELDSYFLTNAVIAYQRDDWRAALNIRNLFDVDYIESTANSRLSVQPGEDLTVIGSVSFKF